MTVLDVPGMINSVVYFIREKKARENSEYVTFSTEQLRDWLIRHKHREYRNEQGGVTSIEGGGISWLMKRLIDRNLIESPRNQHYRNVIKMPKLKKELKDHITEDEAIELSAFFLIRNPEFEPRNLSSHFNELWYGSYAGAAKRKGYHFNVTVILKYLKENNLAQEKQDTVGTIWVANIDNARKLMLDIKARKRK